MAFRLAVVLLIMALAMVAESTTTFHNVDWGLVDFSSIRSSRGDGGLLNPQTCNGKVGDCIDVDEEMMSLYPEATHRILRRRSRYISYGAMKANAIPCSNRGQSYYTNCKYAKRKNPYRRGCSVITRCKRFTN